MELNGESPIEGLLEYQSMVSNEESRLKYSLSVTVAFVLACGGMDIWYTLSDAEGDRCVVDVDRIFSEQVLRGDLCWSGRPWAVRFPRQARVRQIKVGGRDNG